MSLVIRVISTPAFSSVKKSSDSRWKWEKTRTRKPYMSRSPRRPVCATRTPLATALTTTATK